MSRSLKQNEKLISSSFLGTVKTAASKTLQFFNHERNNEHPIDPTMTHIDMDLFSYIFNFISDPVCLIDSDSRILFSNDYFRKCAPVNDALQGYLHTILSEDSGTELLNAIDILKNSEERLHLNHVVLDFVNISYQSRICIQDLIWEISGSREKNIFIIKGNTTGPRNTPMHRLARARQDALAKESLEKFQAIQTNLEEQRLFICCVNHEIRTPLNVIMNGVSFLESKHNEKGEGLSGDRAVTSDTLCEIRLACVAASDIMDDIRVYEQIASSSLQLDHKQIPIANIVSSAAADLKEFAKQADISLACSIHDEEQVHVITDAQLIAHATRNFLSNALKFTPAAGRVEIHVFSVRHSASEDNDTTLDSRDVVRVEVKDTGHGLSKERQASLFQDIVKFTPTVNNTEQGHGVGFFVAHGIVVSHGGKVGVRSDGVGCGATFYFELPVQARSQSPPTSQKVKVFHRGTNFVPPAPLSPKSSGISESFRSLSRLGSHIINIAALGREDKADRVHSTAALNLSQSSQGVAAESFNRSRSTRREQSAVAAASNGPVDSLRRSSTESSCPIFLKLLIVDDVASCRKMLIRLLQLENCICVEAIDGADAMLKLREGRDRGAMFHGVLMDSSMPNMSGPDAAAALRQDGFTLPIIGVTGNAMVDDVNDFLSKGADKVYIKPLRMMEVQAVLAEIRRIF